MRIVSVYSTSGDKKSKEIKSDALTFEELKRDLATNGFSTERMKCIVGETKNTLEAPGSLLPDGDFTLFIMPVKTKSGAMDRSMAYATIKDHIARDGDKAKNYFNAGKNYTNKSTGELEVLIQRYKGSSTKVTKAAVAQVAKSTSQKVENKKPSTPMKKEIKSESCNCDKSIIKSVINKLENISGQDSEDDDEIQDCISDLEDYLEESENTSEPQSKESKLAKQARDLKSEFKDLL